MLWSQYVLNLNVYWSAINKWGTGNGEGNGSFHFSSNVKKGVKGVKWVPKIGAPTTFWHCHILRHLVPFYHRMVYHKNIDFACVIVSKVSSGKVWWTLHINWRRSWVICVGSCILSLNSKCYTKNNLWYVNKGFIFKKMYSIIINANFYHFGQICVIKSLFTCSV